MFKKILLASVLASALLGESMQVKSENSFEVSLEKLQEAIKSKKIKIFSVFDHAQEAKNVGLELEPTSVVVFGAPAVGTKLMQANQDIAYELPLRILVVKKGDEVFLQYENPSDMAAKYGLENNQIIQKMNSLMQMLAKEATEK